MLEKCNIRSASARYDIHVNQPVVGEDIGLNNFGVVEIDVAFLYPNTDSEVVETLEFHAIFQIVRVGNVLESMEPVTSVSLAM